MLRPQGDRAAGFATILGFVALALALSSCTSIDRIDTPTTTRLRVMAYNIKHGHGMDGKIDLPRIAAVIRAQNPDVVTLQEVDNGCARSGGVDQPRVLGELCGMHYAFGPFRAYDGGLYGMAILSRHPIVEAPYFVPEQGAEPRCTIEARIRPPGNGPDVIVTGIHLYRTEEQRLAQARRIVRRYAATTLPVILAGDFNSERGSPVMRELEEFWGNPAKQGAANTFPSDVPVKEIDFVLVRADAGYAVLRAQVVDERLASDHRPIVVDVELLPPGQR